MSTEQNRPYLAESARAAQKINLLILSHLERGLALSPGSFTKLHSSGDRQTSSHLSITITPPAQPGDARRAFNAHTDHGTNTMVIYYSRRPFALHSDFCAGPAQHPRRSSSPRSEQSQQWRRCDGGEVEIRETATGARCRQSRRCHITSHQQPLPIQRPSRPRSTWCSSWSHALFSRLLPVCVPLRLLTGARGDDTSPAQTPSMNSPSLSNPSSSSA